MKWFSELHNLFYMPKIDVEDSVYSPDSILLSTLSKMLWNSVVKMTQLLLHNKTKPKQMSEIHEFLQSFEYDYDAEVPAFEKV